jgi:hypothetical protein
MRLHTALSHVIEMRGQRGEDEGAYFDKIRGRIDPDWIEEALEATGTATIRHRRLPAVQVVWLVIGMALFRNQAIDELVTRLNLVLPSGGVRNSRIAKSAVAKARARLTEKPMEWVFLRTADTWAHQSARTHAWRGLAVYGIDGTTMAVPDSDDNATYFGYAKSGRGRSGYPVVRIVGLMALRSHLLAGMCYRPYSEGEVTVAYGLLTHIPEYSLTILDRAYLSVDFLSALTQVGCQRHFLTRAKKNTRVRIIQRFGRGDVLVQMTVSPEARKGNPDLPPVWHARMIAYHRKGFRTQFLLTSLADAEAYPRKEIVTLYHERWEIELGYREIKSGILTNTPVLRSQTHVNVEQELWGLFLAYNLIRLEMERVATEAHVKPTQISFIVALHLIIDELLWCSFASPGTIPKHLLHFRRELEKWILPDRRSHRSFPRVVKIKMSKYKKKSVPILRRKKA